MRTGYLVFSKSEAGRLSGPSADFSLNKIIIVVFMGLGCSPTIFPFFRTLFVQYVNLCAHLETQRYSLNVSICGKQDTSDSLSSFLSGEY